MKASELRIGNLVQNEHGAIYKAYAITKNGSRYFIGYTEDKMSENYIEENNLQDKAFPIALTEEWLLRFGFGLYSSEGRFTIGLNNETSLLITIEKDSENQYCHIDIHQHVDKNNDDDEELVYFTKANWHVHQLQNLYFALTGKELELK